MTMNAVAEEDRPRQALLPAARSGAKGAVLMPPTYADAKAALQRCSRVDECRDFADRAIALAVYAKQAKDKQLEVLARRIRARAVRRAGELLNQIPTCRGRRRDLYPHSGIGARTKAAREAGLTTSQHKAAIRLANLPPEIFEAEVESPNPPGTATLAKRHAARHCTAAPVRADGEGDALGRARRILADLLTVYREAPPRIRARIRDMVARGFTDEIDQGTDRLTA
jgi:hypothetical protein